MRRYRARLCFLLFVTAVLFCAQDGTTFVMAATVNSSDGGLRFVPIATCRLADTRNPAGPFGGPVIAGGTSRDFAVPNGACGIPVTAAAYALNVTAVPHGGLGYLTVWPSGQTQPYVSTLNSLDGRVKANAAIIPAGTNGAISIFASNTSDVVLDISGYFVPASDPAGLAFYPVTPCRIADTREANGPFGGPYLSALQNRTIPVLSSSCNLPPGAAAYSLNVTAVPRGALSWLSAWPTGQPWPGVSTLNAPTGTIVANAAIVAAGTGGGIDLLPSHDANVVIDINGYFAPANSGAGGLSLYNVSPCRVLDTRQTSGAFNGTLGVAVAQSSCGAPTSAQAFALNATVVPREPLGYLTLWPDGQEKPWVSTLNAMDGAVSSNMAIVPTTNGSISAFTAGTTDLVLDINGYFAPIGTPGVLNLAPLSVGQDLEYGPATVSVGSAPDTAVAVTIKSADPSRVQLATDAAQAGSEAVTVTIQAGSTVANPGFYVQALATSGTIQFTASGPGYSPVNADATLTPSGFALGGDISTDLATDVKLRISAYQLTSDLSQFREQRLRRAVDVTVTSTNPAVGTMVCTGQNSACSCTAGASCTVSISAGYSNSEGVSFHPVSPGSTILCITQPPGFSHPSAGECATTTVNRPAPVLGDVVVGSNLQVKGAGYLSAAPTQDTYVTVKSSDPTSILLSTNPSVQGTGSVDLLVAKNTTAFPPFYVQAVAPSGQFSLTASAAGYQTGTTPHGVMITPSALLIAGPSGDIGEPFTTTTISADSSLNLLVYRLDNATARNPISPGQIRGGASVPVTVTADNAGVGAVLYNPAILAGGDTGNGTLAFKSLGAGVTRLTVQQPAGFSTPSSGDNLSITVVQPTISFRLPSPCTQTACNIGNHQEVLGRAALNVAAPAEGVVVTISSSDPHVLLSTDPMSLGAATISVTVPAGKGVDTVGFPTFYIQATQAPGSATITASAAGWISAVASVNVTPSGFCLSGPNGFGDVGTIVGNDVTLTVNPWQLDSSLSLQSIQAVITTVTVSLQPNGILVPPSVAFHPGDYAKDVVFHATAPGTTIFSITQPPGFSSPVSCSGIRVTVR